MAESDFSNRQLMNQNQAQQRGPTTGPVGQQFSVESMYEQLAGVIRDMKSVMKNFKVFFNKYLQPEQNHFMNPQKQQRPRQHYQQPMNQNYESNPPVQQNYPPQYQYYEAEKSTEQMQLPKQMPHYQYEKQEFDHSKQKKKTTSFKFKKDKPASDPNKPKAPLTPYFMFFQQNREILRQRYPEMSLAQIGSLGGKIWGNLTDDEKYTYKSRYQDELKEYRIKMRNYKSSDNFLGVRTPMPTQYSGNVLEIDEDEGF